MQKDADISEVKVDDFVIYYSGGSDGGCYKVGPKDDFEAQVKTSGTFPTFKLPGLICNHGMRGHDHHNMKQLLPHFSDYNNSKEGLM
jgi:hypothetical protein